MAASIAQDGFGQQDMLVQPARRVLRQQVVWFIYLRWVAIACIFLAGTLATQVFPILQTAGPLYVCGLILLVMNAVYFGLARGRTLSEKANLVLAMIQIVGDLLILTLLIHFSGGIYNPFVFFYVFHIIVATIMLPGTLSFAVGVTAIAFYGILVVAELQGWPGMQHQPLQFSSSGALWQNPVYAMWNFVAFVVMVLLTQYLTRHIVERLIARELEVARMNELLRASQVEMAQKEKMIALGQMASGIAHEIGNPLNSLSSVTQLLLRQQTDEKSRKNLGLIQQQVERISRILSQLLGIARPGPDEYTWTDINNVVQNTLELVRYDKRARDVQLHYHAADDLPTVWMKPQNLEQVLLNVLINALDAIAASERKNAGQIDVITHRSDGDLEITVTDNGTGIATENVASVFQPFFTTKDPRHGTGLGLYISRNLMTELDGEISLCNNDSHGTRAHLRFPARTVPHGAMEQPADKHPSAV